MMLTTDNIFSGLLVVQMNGNNSRSVQRVAYACTVIDTICLLSLHISW